MRVIARVAVAALLLPAGGARAAVPSWPDWGGMLAGNQREAPLETAINTATASGLALKWSFTGQGNMAATPTVQGTGVFVTDDGGGLYRLDAATGQVVWQHQISNYTGLPWSRSRSSPALAGGIAVIADRQSGAVLGIDQATGNLIWQRVVESNPSATLTASPMIYKGVVYIGTSSNEEYEVSVNANYVLSFRGSIAALDLKTGALLWQTYMVPPGYTGGAVWGSGFAVSATQGSLYVATGNNYSVTAKATRCLRTAMTKAAQIACLDPADYVDSIVALDLATGQVRWGTRLQGADTFTLNCTASKPAQPCPTPTGPDYDFGSAPNILSYRVDGEKHELVGAGQKSGTYYALDPATGAVAWATQAGPGGARGGIMWGSAVNAGHVFVAENDYGHAAYALGPAGKRTTSGGSWAALDPASGRILWQVPATPAGAAEPAGAESALTVANGVLFAGTADGRMIAVSANSGRQLWSFDAGAGVTCGPSVVGGVVYWGSGDPYGIGGDTLFAFSVPGS